jgi:hypothetical protein
MRRLRAAPDEQAEDSAQSGQDLFLIRENLIQLLLIPEQFVQFRLICFDAFLIRKDFSLVGENLLLVCYRCVSHPRPPRFRSER